MAIGDPSGERKTNSLPSARHLGALPTVLKKLPSCDGQRAIMWVVGSRQFCGAGVDCGASLTFREDVV
jgi:hypothetical protein